MDKAHKQTDKIIESMERKISEVYSSSLALRRIKKRYEQFMESVWKRTEASYRAYMDESDILHREELKRAYMDEIRAYTMQDKEYWAIIDQFTKVLAEVNQQAVDVANDGTSEVYALNYNQVAEECKKVGIRVNDGRREKKEK